MRGISWLLACELAIIALTGCGAPPAPSAAAPSKPAAGAEQVNRIVERYWDDRQPAENAISPQSLADSLSMERRYLAEILATDRDGLDAKSKLTYDIFRRQREIAIEGFTYPLELLPIDPVDGMPQELAADASELASRPSTKAVDYQNWLKRMDDYVRWTQQATVNMREGMRRGYTSPRALIERFLPLIERLGADDSANVFYGPIRSLPDGIQASDRAKLTRDMTSAVSERLLPANRALHDFLQKEYLPRARVSLALSDLPLGSGWYAYRVRRATGSALSPVEINRIGLAEVERLGSPAAREVVRDAVPAAPAGGLLNAYRELQSQVQAALPAAFAEIPTAEFDIRPADWLPRPGLALRYQPKGSNGFPPAVLYVNTGKGARATPSVAGFLQRALPGEHFQSALQQERSDLPRFRRFGTEPAFTEGWGLYAVSLGETLGLYTDDVAKLDAASAQMLCAVALVVDSSLQVKGWTRGQAFDYLRAHLAIEDLDAQSLIDAYAARPGDAMACMMGELKIRALRSRAQQSLGSRFDLRDFHTEVLKDGAMPMDILETKMKAWMDISK
jgi:uncharacterized protein (DUF885 family)